MMSNNEIIERGDDSVLPVAAHLSQAIQAGLPLESGLRALAEQTRSPRTRSSLIELSQNLERGMPLSDALQASESGLPRPMKALVHAGMETGRLDSVMRYCIEQSQRAISLRQQIWLSISYPVFLIWFAALICGAILLFIVPAFKRIFDDFGTELPGLTVAIITLSDAMAMFGQWSWVCFLILGIGVALVFVLIGLSKWGQRRATSIPLIGRVFRFAALSDLCQILAILVESGLSFPKAIAFAGNASDDQWLNRQCDSMALDIENGSTPEAAVVFAELPTTLAQVFRSATSERALSESLRGLADIYVAECFVTSRLVSTLMAPFSITIVISFVGMTAIALFLPLIKLLNDLS